MNKIRILIADDHKLMRMGLVSLLSCKDDMDCVGEARNGEEAVALARTLKPDVIIMDLMMPKLSGATATKIIHEELPNSKIIVLTSYGTSKEMSDAIVNGAHGTLMKDVETDCLVATIRNVVAGKTAIPRELQDTAEEDLSVGCMTDHQKNILASIATGRTNADIAKEFGIAESTVKNTLQRIYACLGVANRSEAVSIALRKHLIKI